MGYTLSSNKNNEFRFQPHNMPVMFMMWLWKLINNSDIWFRLT